MTLEKQFLLGILLLFGSSVYAQEQKVRGIRRVFLSALHPTLSYLKNRSFNGGGGGVQYNFTGGLRD